jgi:hypothetical protein
MSGMSGEPGIGSLELDPDTTELAIKDVNPKKLLKRWFLNSIVTTGTSLIKRILTSSRLDNRGIM